MQTITMIITMVVVIILSVVVISTTGSYAGETAAEVSSMRSLTIARKEETKEATLEDETLEDVSGSETCEVVQDSYELSKESLQEVEESLQKHEDSELPKESKPSSSTYSEETMESDSEDNPEEFSEVDEETYLLAQILTAEAVAEGEAEMLRVGTVLMNRIETTYYEFSECVDVKSTLEQSGAYPTTLQKIRQGLKPSEEAIQIAQRLMAGERTSEFGSNVYWQTLVEPDFNAEVEYVSAWHYYSSPKE